jgi:hypothetical protein
MKTLEEATKDCFSEENLSGIENFSLWIDTA